MLVMVAIFYPVQSCEKAKNLEYEYKELCDSVGVGGRYSRHG